MLKELVQYRWVQGWHINASGNLFGGSLLSFIDEDTMMVAHLNANSDAIFTTAGMDQVSFLKPSKRGERLKFEHKIVYSGRTSLWTYSKVTNTANEVIFSCLTTLVAVNKDGKPVLLKDYIDDKIIESIPHNECWSYVETLKKRKRYGS